MKLGISTASFYPLITEQALEKICKSGIKYTEIFFNCNYELTDGFINELKTIADFYGTKITSVHPTASLAESCLFF